MALKTRKPQAKKIGVKVLGFGDTGVGKSSFGLTFPKLFALDSETGLSWYEEFAENIVEIANTQDYNDIEEAIDMVLKMAKSGEIETLLIDSESKFYQNLQNVILQLEEKKARKKGKDELDAAVSQRGWGKIKSISQRLQNLKLDLSAMGVHVVSIAQEDEIKEKQGEQMVRVGERASMAKKTEYDYDIVLRFFTDEDFEGNIIYKATVLKDRTGVYKKGDVIENVTYDMWAEKISANKKGVVVGTSLANDEKKAADTRKTYEHELTANVESVFKELLTQGSDELRKQATLLIKQAKIANPMKPKNDDEREKLADIVEKLKTIK